MSFHRRANRLLQLALPAALALGILAAVVPGLGFVLDEGAVGAALLSLVAFSAAAGIALPVVSMLLDRRRPGSEPYGAQLRSASIFVAAGSVALGTLGAIADDSPWRFAGALLAACGVAITIAALRYRPRRSAADSPGFGATLFGVVLFAMAFLTLPYFSDTRQRAYRRAMESDLRNLVAEQEFHRDTAGAYDPGLILDGHFRGTTGVTLDFQPTTDGWTARATHGELAGSCAVFVGTTRIAPATDPGSVACDTDDPSAAGSIAAGSSALLLGSGLVLFGIGLAWQRRQPAPRQLDASRQAGARVGASRLDGGADPTR